MKRADPIDRGEPVTLTVNGQPVRAYLGQSVAAALLAAGHRTLRHTRHAGKPRGLFCAMGACYDCVVTVDGESGVRACMRRVEEGMQVISPARFGQHVPRP